MNRKSALYTFLLVMIIICLTGCIGAPKLNGKIGLTQETLDERMIKAGEIPFSGDIEDFEFCVIRMTNEMGRLLSFPFLDGHSCRFIHQECIENEDVCKWDIRNTVSCWKGKCEPRFQGHCTCRYDKQLVEVNGSLYWKNIEVNK